MKPKLYALKFRPRPRKEIKEPNWQKPISVFEEPRNRILALRH